MSMKNRWKQDDLLSDLEVSIERALAAGLTDLAGALMRLQGSARGWCDLSECGPCPLSPNHCVTGLEEKVEQLIKQYHSVQRRQHVKKQSTKPQINDLNIIREAKLSKSRVHRHAARLYQQLGSRAPELVSKKLSSINPSNYPARARNWRLIRTAITTVVLKQQPAPASSPSFVTSEF